MNVWRSLRKESDRDLPNHFKGSEQIQNPIPSVLPHPGAGFSQVWHPLIRLSKYHVYQDEYSFQPRIA